MMHYEHMNTNKIKQIFLRLMNELSILAPRDQPKESRLLDHSLIVHGRLLLEGVGADHFTDALEEVCAEVLPDGTWSRGSVTDLLAECVANVASASSDERQGAIRAESVNLAEKLKALPLDWEVEFSIGGMLPDCNGFTFGRMHFASSTVKLPVPMPGLTDADGSVTSIFVKVKVRAIDQVSAIAIAESDLDQQLSVLNALCAQSPPSLFRIHRGQPENPFRYQVIRANKVREVNPSTRFGSRRIGVEISRSGLEAQLKARRGDLVSSFLERRDSFAERLMSGYAIAGAGCVERQPQLSFLLFAIALESTILGSQTNMEITYQLSSRVAHLLTKDIGRRRALAKEVSELYRLRSKVVHSGEDQIAKSDLIRIWQFCMLALSAIATRPEFGDMSTAEELDRWFEDRMLGSPE
jgi:hypothetical protein